jgi:ribosomal protein S27AE
MTRRHNPRGIREELLHDFDVESRTLRIAFVSPEGRIVGITYKLCPLCGVTMEEEKGSTGSRWACVTCGLTTS